jgi:hypothetical protein
MTEKIIWAELSKETLTDRRKDERLKLQYDLDVSGLNPDGKSFSISARARDISRHGCSFEIARTMLGGEIVSLSVVRKNSLGIREATKPVPFRIMWVAKENELFVVGAEMVMPADPWGVDFPPKIVPPKPH